MRSILALGLGTILLMGTAAVANTPQRADCPRPDSGAFKITWEKKETGTYELASSAWCCCNTAAGQCCSYAAVCSPAVIGCACL